MLLSTELAPARPARKVRTSRSQAFSGMIRTLEEAELRQRHELDRGELAHGTFPQAPPLRRRRLRQPARLGIGRNADRNPAGNLLHDEERGA